MTGSLPVGILRGHTALVSGASRGIGAAIADTLALLGARVCGTATAAAGATALQQRLQAINPECLGLVLDVNQAGSCEALVQDLNAQSAAPTILVNNAGITRDQLLLRMQEEDWDAVIDTDLRSVFRLTKACLRGMMKARQGRIICISSVIGAMGNAGQANYAAAKAGMQGFCRSLAREVGSRGITVNAIAPGFIDTDMTQALRQEQRAALLESIPLQRLGQPADIAGAVAFLCSPAAAYITGQTLHVNGGMYM